MRVAAMLALDARDAAVVGALRALAARRPVHLTVVHAVERAPAEPGVLEARLRAAVGEPSGAEVVATVRVGSADAVAQSVFAEDAFDLLVFGRTAGEDGQPAWGENGRALLRSAGCPVLVVPADAASLRFGRAAVGMDLSPSALDALALAAALCDEVEAVAILAPDDAPDSPDAVRASVQARFDAALAERRLPPVRLRTVAAGAPADALLAVADEVDLLAVGSRGLSPLATVFLGSTAERLAGRSARPVLVVRRRGGARGLLGALFGS